MAKGAFMPPALYSAAVPALSMSSILDAHDSKCDSTADEWTPTGIIHRAGHIGAQLDYTREEGGKTPRCYGVKGACPKL
jgi:hypothetical protein